jgi:hypothetical protein
LGNARRRQLGGFSVEKVSLISATRYGGVSRMVTYTIAQVAEMIDRSRQTVTRYIERGLLDATKDKHAGTVRVTVESVRQLRRKQIEILTQTYGTTAAARILRCAPRTVQRLVKAGELDAQPAMSGRGLRVLTDSITRYQIAQRGARQ